MAIPLLSRVHDWQCPACGLTAQTNEVQPHTEFHPCPKNRGIAVPMLPAGTKAKIEIREREDYVAGEVVQLDPELGRPVMSLVVTRDDGQDTTVFAPLARARG